ncbi:MULTISPECIES: hypothetical protein [unclassified Pseudomonas]|jgi:hypothetical protein|uniref:hypothetical protein n=1 Tax=unclassified Pseudomonas TaxID=196821 RepID=UPI0011AF32D2|nr:MULTISPECIES: hypothetical protein [unclassified Pseudomonas]
MPAIQQALKKPCGSETGFPAMAFFHSILMLADPPLSRAGSLPQGFVALGDPCKSCPDVFELGQPPPLTYAAPQRFCFWSILWVVVFF